MVILQSYFPSCKITVHTMTVELHYKLHSKLVPVMCTVNNIGLAGLLSECTFYFNKHLGSPNICF